MRTGAELWQAVEAGRFELTEVAQRQLSDPGYEVAAGQVVVFDAVNTGLSLLEKKVGEHVAATICPDPTARAERETFDEIVRAAGLSTPLLVHKTLGVPSSLGNNLAVVVPGAMERTVAEDGKADVTKYELTLLLSLFTRRPPVKGKPKKQFRADFVVRYTGDKNRMISKALKKAYGWVGRTGIKMGQPNLAEAEAYEQLGAGASVLELARLALQREYG